MALQQRERARRERRLGHPHLGGEQREKVIGEQADVLDAIAQRRHLDQVSCQAEVQILAGRRRSAIRSWRSALVAATTRTSTRLGWLAPTGTTCPSSSTRSIFAWRAGGMSPISSRNSVPPSASSNHPLRSVECPGERAARVAEQQRFGQLARNRDTVHGNERRRRARAAAVDRARDQLLAGAALSGDQHVGAGELMQPLDLREDPPHQPAAADESRNAPALHVLLGKRDEPLRRRAPRAFRFLTPADFRFELRVSVDQLARQPGDLAGASRREPGPRRTERASRCSPRRRSEIRAAGSRCRPSPSRTGPEWRASRRRP